MSDTLLEVKDLCKYYKTPKGALHAVEDPGRGGRVRMRQVHPGLDGHEPP